MKPKILTGVVLGPITVLIAHYLFMSTAVAQLALQQGVPLFEADPYWPKVPERWKLGQVSNIAVDERDRVLILQRPRSLPADQQAKAAPPVLEFDAGGNFIRGWGGPGIGYDWPEIEHGIHVDYKGNVWIGGNNCPERNLPGLRPVSDDQLLKFTRDGKFVMQIGRSNQTRGNSDTTNLNMPADAFVYRKTNEVFVADGYGNRRVIVFDADTGRFKRMWGAFGNKPVDAYRCPTNEVDRNVIGVDGPGPERFDVVHAVRVSNDDLVYVSDRNYRRVQVFTLSGKFIDQVFFGRSSNGNPGAVAFSPDPEQKFLYVVSSEIEVLNRKTLEIIGSVAGGRGAHHIASDSKGNLYTSHLGQGGAGRAQKFFVFKGMSSSQSR
jgi:hypothetical protein